MAADANKDQSEFWNDSAGRKWVQEQEILDAMLQQYSDVVMGRLEFYDGDRILDVGCGCGGTSLVLAEKVGPTGSVLGVDISDVMLVHARERARTAAIENISFEHCDAQEAELPEQHYDVVFSRFGIMFFDDPEKAFTNFFNTLHPDGEIGFACWQAVAQNEWISAPLGLIGKHVDLPAPTPGAPGPFAFADPERIGQILMAAGFDQVSILPVEKPIVIGDGTVAGALDFTLKVGPASALLADADESVTRSVVKDLEKLFSESITDGRVEMQSSAWAVTARRTREQ